MMEASTAPSESYLTELRLLLEEVCCDLCRFEHVVKEGAAPQSVQIDREFYLGAPDAFADVRIAPASSRPYFVEVKYGYTDEKLVRHWRGNTVRTYPARAWAAKWCWSSTSRSGWAGRPCRRS